MTKENQIWLANFRFVPTETGKTAFISACVIGFITHIYIFTNLLLNHDSVWRIYYDNNNLATGRWALKTVSDISTKFQLPVVIAVISILALALTAALTVEFFEIHKKLNVILISAFLVTFPTVACIFSYMFTADAYFIALLLNAAAAYIAKKYPKGWFISVVLCAVACGIYQAFLCYAIGMLLMDCIFDLLGEKTVAETTKKGIRYIFILIFSLLLWYAVLKILLAVTGIALTSYQGLSSMSLSNIKGFLMQVPTAYYNFLKYFLVSAYSTKFYKMIYVLFMLMTGGLLLFLIVNRKLYKSVGKCLLFLLGIALLPLALNFITVLSAGAEVHALMIYAFVLLEVLGVKVVELSIENGQAKKKLCWTATFVAGLLIWNNFCISNTAYLRLQVCYENSYALANRITARIELQDGYSPDLPVAIIGQASSKIYGGTVGEFSQINSLTGIDSRLLYSTEPHIRTRTFIEDYIGIHMKQPTQAQKEMLQNAEEVNEMPSYPAQGSIVIYNDVVVVKLSDGTVR